ncbi:hypothetical protein HZH68_005836 [Vespula germanica]|uniref:t-SNARE coiled-coil homology domain-containing protein n=1 Tax=Vespula germanica TaxID=30212 RepID=A0A834KID9_VESGE|nr:hypothetical protein HZH68_005836 [Vespula germanica]
MNSQIDWEQRRTLLESNAALERTSQSLTRSHIIATESEQIGTEVISELAGQSERLLRAKRRLSQTDEELNKTRRILNRMKIGVLTNKEAFEEVDTCSSIMELQQNDQNEDTTALGLLQFDLDLDGITTLYYTPPQKYRAKRKIKMDNKSQSQTSLLKWNYNANTEEKIGAKYRPIYPKPYQTNFFNKPKIFGFPSAINEFPALNSTSHIILPSKEKVQDCTILNKPNKRTRNYSKPITENSNCLKLLIKENGIETNSNKNNTILRQDFSFIKMEDEDKSSIELFFESMAQTVLSLPMHVQAEIKMEICKLVTKAEIKYSLAQSKNNCKID